MVPSDMADTPLSERGHLQAARVASFVAQGETLYLDFFENHPPLTYPLLQPVVRSSSDPGAIVTRARG